MVCIYTYIRIYNYRTVGMFGSREFGESSVLCQTLTSQILAYK